MIPIKNQKYNNIIKISNLNNVPATVLQIAVHDKRSASNTFHSDD